MDEVRMISLDVFWTNSSAAGHMLDSCCNGPDLAVTKAKQSKLYCVIIE